MLRADERRPFAIQGRCITPQPVPLPVKKVPTPQPQPAPGPTPKAVPVSTVVFFEQNKPGTAAKDEEGLRKSLTSEGSKNFDLLAKELKDNPTFKVQLAGKASSEGPTWYNLGLAGRRARLVADVLVGMGIDRSRISEPPDGGSECKKVEEGIHNCGEAGAAAKTDPNDRQVRAQVFTVP
jgi:OmpA family